MGFNKYAMTVGVLFMITCCVQSYPLRSRRDVVDTAKSVYDTVVKGTKAVFNDLIGNTHVAAESYRQAADASQRVAPAFQDIFVNQNKAPVPVGPPVRPTPAWESA